MAFLNVPAEEIADATLQLLFHHDATDFAWLLVDTSAEEYQITLHDDYPLSAAGASQNDVTPAGDGPQTVVFTPATSAAVSNTLALTFAAMTACTVSHICIWFSTGSEPATLYPLQVIELDTARTVADGDTLLIEAGELVVTLDADALDS